jgi:hypothetical protein
VTDETASNSGTAGTDTTAATDRGEWTANTNGESLLLAVLTLLLYSAGGTAAVLQASYSLSTAHVCITTASAAVHSLILQACLVLQCYGCERLHL